MTVSLCMTGETGVETREISPLNLNHLKRRVDMSQGAMQMKSKFFVAMALFVVFVLFTFFFFGVPMRFFSMVHATAMAAHNVVGNDVVSTVPMLNGIVML